MIWRDSVTFADGLKRLPLTRVNTIFGPKVAVPEGSVLHGCSITTRVVERSIATMARLSATLDLFEANV